MLQALIGPVTNLVGKFIEDKDQKNKLAHELATMAENHAQELDKGQIDINKAEASHKSIFVAGWRPFIGWTCGVALAYTYVLQPLLTFILAQTGTLVDLPRIELGEMMPVLMGILGLGGLRTFEKFKGVSK